MHPDRPAWLQVIALSYEDYVSDKYLAKKYVEPLIRAGAKVVDLSRDSVNLWVLVAQSPIMVICYPVSYPDLGVHFVQVTGDKLSILPRMKRGYGRATWKRGLATAARELMACPSSTPAP